MSGVRVRLNRSLGLHSVGLVFGNDLRLDRKQLGPRRIDRDADPMGIRIAKGFDPYKVLEKPLRLLAEQRFADMENVGVAVHERGRLLVGFHLRS